MKKVILVLTVFHSLYAFGSVERDREVLLEQNPKEPVNQLDIEKYPELYNYSDSLLRELNTSTGTYDERYYSRHDNGYLSLNYHFSQDYQNPNKVQSFSLKFLNRKDNSYHDFWYALNFQFTTGRYSAMADERTSTSGDANSVANETRLDNEQTISTVGGGLAYRFKALSTVFEHQRFFEVIAVFLNYNFHQDSTNNESYQGFGYSAEYSLTYRINETYFYGGKINYNWAFVERDPVDEEKLADRTLVFGWTSLGIEIGYIY